MAFERSSTTLTSVSEVAQREFTEGRLSVRDGSVWYEHALKRSHSLKRIE